MKVYTVEYLPYEGGHWFRDENGEYDDSIPDMDGKKIVLLADHEEKLKKAEKLYRNLAHYGDANTYCAAMDEWEKEMKDT